MPIDFFNSKYKQVFSIMTQVPRFGNKLCCISDYDKLCELLKQGESCGGKGYIAVNHMLSTTQGYRNSFYQHLTGLGCKGILESAATFTPSGSIADEAKRMSGADASKLKVVSLAGAAVKNESGFVTLYGPQQEINIYCIAALHPHEGHLRLLHIIAELVHVHGIALQLFFRGHQSDPVYWQTILDLISELKLNDHVKYLPYANELRLDEMYANAHWVVLLSDYEGFGLPLLEAQSHGVPVICSDIPVFRKVAGDGAFFISGKKTAVQAAASLASLFRKPAQRALLIANGHQNRRRFSWERFSGETWQIYKSVAGSTTAKVA